MEQFANMIGSWISLISDKLNFGRDASVATMIICILAGIGLATVCFKFVKKALGKVVAIILVVAILMGSGFISMSQLKNYAEGAGLIYKNGVPEAAEKDGKWLIELFENLAPGEDEGAGSWVPEKEDAKAEDWLPE